MPRGEAGMSKRVDRAERKFRQAADQGDPAAQFDLGHAYYLDAHLDTTSTGDYSDALALIRKSADQGYSLALSHLGYVYKLGEGVPTDLLKSKSWFLKAAESGEPHDQYQYATMCWNGDFGERYPREAEFWWLKAADHGMAEAHDALGGHYGDRYGGKAPKDPVAGYMWYTLAALRNEPGHSPEAARTARDQLAETMTQDQVTDAETLVQDWLESHRGIMEANMVRNWRECLAEPLKPLSPKEAAALKAEYDEMMEKIKVMQDNFGKE